MANNEDVLSNAYDGGSEGLSAPEPLTSDSPVTSALVLYRKPEVLVEAILPRLIAEARNLHLRGRLYRIALGRVLLAIHAVKAKPGCGSFTQTVTIEIGMPYTTARDYMQEADAEDRYESRNEVRVADPAHVQEIEVADYDPNDGSPDAVAVAIKKHQQGLLEAGAATKDPDRVRDFNWKFKGISFAFAEALKEAKAKLGSERAATILVEAAKISLDEEVLNAGIAA